MSDHSIGVALEPAITSHLMKTDDVAVLLSCSASWLNKARLNGDGPPFIRMGRSVRYLEADVRQWIETNRRCSTSES